MYKVTTMWRVRVTIVETTTDSVSVLELYVTVSHIQILSAAQQCFMAYSRCMQK